jgi:hypothetical protein
MTNEARYLICINVTLENTNTVRLCNYAPSNFRRLGELPHTYFERVQ